MTRNHRFVAAAALSILIAGPALAADAPTDLKPVGGIADKLPDENSATSALLGEPYENQAAGVSFRPPVGAAQTPSAGGQGNTVAEFMDEKRQWLLKVTKPSLSNAMPLQSVKDPKTGQIERTGLLDYTVGEILKTNPTAKVERQDYINVGEYSVGVAAIRITLGNATFLRQQAIFQADEKSYFVFNLTTPASSTLKPEEDPQLRDAAKSFMAMLDTIQILDQSWIRKDQVQRLFRTRALFVDWDHQGGKRIRDAIVPEQWLRITKNGKDIGYSYIVEEAVDARDIKGNPWRAFDGILISTRSRTMDNDSRPDGKQTDVQVDIGSQLFMSLDRKHEDWAHVVNVVHDRDKPTEKKQQNTEYGFSEHKRIIRPDRVPGAPRDPKDPKNPAVQEIESYRLSVMKAAAPQPKYFVPSPWYVSQAVGSMLPRLIPVNKPVTYLFQSYVSHEDNVVHRYIDVGFEKEVTINGKTQRAIPISDRVGLEGNPTIHYMTTDGKWIATINERDKTMVLPSNAEELKKIWKDAADLRKPDEIKRPEGAIPETPSGASLNRPR